MTLGQQLLVLGHPLWGDLSLDGYRSENVVWGPGFTVQDAIRFWRSDDPHTDTMLSPNRSDIGAAVASGQDEWGFTIYYYVLETALQTRSGKMQSDAYPTLTAIASNQAACRLFPILPKEEMIVIGIYTISDDADPIGFAVLFNFRNSKKKVGYLSKNGHSPRL